MDTAIILVQFYARRVKFRTFTVLLDLGLYAVVVTRFRLGLNVVK